MSKILSILAIFLSLYSFGLSENNQANNNSRESTGGAQTLEDILKRQNGEIVDYDFRKNALGPMGENSSTTIPLGTLGLTSDAEIFRQLRYNEANINVSSKTAASEILVQDSGMSWLTMREGPLLQYGGLALIGMIALLSFFYLVRGRIPVEEGLSGITIERFKPVERFAHWLLASSFILLGLTGILTLFGRTFLIPIIGHETFSIIAIGSKWIHIMFHGPLC